MMIISNQTPLRSSTKIPFLNTAQLSQLRITEALKHFNPVQVAPGGHELELQGHSIPPLHPAVLVYTAWTLAMESLIDPVFLLQLRGPGVTGVNCPSSLRMEYLQHFATSWNRSNGLSQRLSGL